MSLESLIIRKFLIAENQLKYVMQSFLTTYACEAHFF